MLRALCLSLLLPAALASAAAPRIDLRTESERSGFRVTGRYAEVERLCPAFEAAYPGVVRCFAFGRTPEGRPMLAMAVSRAGVLTPEANRDRQLPVLLVQGGIHAGEIDGKDAGFLAIRQALEGKAAKGALEREVLLFVPVFNVDGHERFGAWNRPNQRGPEQMGWRTTGQNLNLNRDYVKADAPEMQAMLALVEAWDPLVYVDLHVTDGAKFQHDVSIQVEPLHGGDEGMRAAGKVLRDETIARLARQGSLPLPFYPSFVASDDPASGFEDGVSPPRFSTGYFPLRNRFAMLVETHSWKDYPTRVRITRNTVVALMDIVAAHGGQWHAVADAADGPVLAGQPVALDYKASDAVRTIDFLGYAYTRTPSDVSGGLMTRYDESRPQVWRVPLRDDVRPSLVVTAPTGGYLVPAAFAQQVAAKLRLHGLAFRVLEQPLARQAVEAFRAESAAFSTPSVEGHQRLSLAGRWARETRDVGAGALFVPIGQPRGRLVMALLEPQAPDSIAAWGGFNNAFEQKEYMEDYVAEDVAREYLAKDPALAAEFADRLRNDPQFAASSAARLQFFARRHPSWDERFNLYPVLRIAAVPGG